MKISLNKSIFASIKALLLLLIPISTARAQEGSVKLFDRVKSSIVQVKIIENDSGTKSSIGSGFFVNDKIVTNYHVVSGYVFDPSLYKIDIVLSNEKIVPATIEKIDVIHDLAILAPKETLKELPLAIESQPISKGEKIYAIGNPKDLGQAIVEGTYNGKIEESLYQRIHFTGSLNPGMSGGPAVLSNGNVVGVNVSSSGDQMSFLVPAEFITELMAAPKQDATGKGFLVTVREQLIQNQKNYIKETLQSEFKNISLGDFSVPGKLSKAFKCWSDVKESGDLPYNKTSQFCSTEDDIYLNENLTAGSIAVQHHFIQSTDLNLMQFSALLQSQLSKFEPGYYGTREQVSAYDCKNSIVKTKATPISAAICLRKYKKFDGLYDGAVVFSTLPTTSRGLVSSLSLSGVSAESFKEITNKFLNALEWKTDS